MATRQQIQSPTSTIVIPSSIASQPDENKDSNKCQNSDKYQNSVGKDEHKSSGEHKNSEESTNSGGQRFSVTVYSSIASDSGVSSSSQSRSQSSHQDIKQRRPSCKQDRLICFPLNSVSVAHQAIFSTQQLQSQHLSSQDDSTDDCCFNVDEHSSQSLFGSRNSGVIGSISDNSSKIESDVTC